MAEHDQPVPISNPNKHLPQDAQRIAAWRAAGGALLLLPLAPQAPVFIIGYWLSTWLRGGYIAVAAVLGCCGSFFSGSVATSNLTFGSLQASRGGASCPCLQCPPAALLVACRKV